MSANDDEDYIRREIDWLSAPLLESRFYLGICLGAQMLVRPLGGIVATFSPLASRKVYHS